MDNGAEEVWYKCGRPRGQQALIPTGVVCFNFLYPRLILAIRSGHQQSINITKSVGTSVLYELEPQIHIDSSNDHYINFPMEYNNISTTRGDRGIYDMMIMDLNEECMSYF